MNNFDSLTLKYFYSENTDFIKNSVVQKIQLPSRYEIILNIRNIDKSQNKKLYININPKYPHICFINDETSQKRDIKIPKSPPMFCMQLRKYLNGSKIKDFKIVPYERILEFYFDYFDEIGSLTRVCLACEFMGKYSNVILYNAQNKVIIGASHNVSSEKSSKREIYGGINYIYPELKTKLDILNTGYATFLEIAKDSDIKKISDNFYYFTQPFLAEILKKNSNIEDIFKLLQSIQNQDNKKILCAFWNGENKTINDAIDNYFCEIMFFDILKTKKAALKKHLTQEIKKLSKTVQNKIEEEKYKKYKTFADYILAYSYQIKQGQKEVIIDNLKIELDENLSINDNAQKYYKLYKKAKSEFSHQEKRQQEAKNKLDYYQEIIFNIENSSDFSDLDEIKEELIGLGFIKEKNNLKQTPKLNKITYKGFDIYIGKNSLQNDYLISKVAKSEDLWFHGLNFPSAHIILKIPSDKKTAPKEVIEFCAKLTKENSKARFQGKTSIIMTQRKNLKKPPDTYLGYVTYKNEIEIVID